MSGDCLLHIFRIQHPLHGVGNMLHLGLLALNGVIKRES
jgi:hypothetical protein